MPVGQPVRDIVLPAWELLQDLKDPIHLWLAIIHVQMYGVVLSVREVKEAACCNWINIRMSNAEYLNENFDR